MSYSNIRFTVVTVCYNCENSIEKTISSILNQKLSPYEYIIIDGLSSDKTVEIAESYTDKFKEKNIIYKVISEKDLGIYNAMNKGIKNANGDFISFLNSGDWYEDGTLYCINNKYNENPFDLCYGSINYHNLDGTTYLKKSKVDKKFVTSRHWNHPSMFLKSSIYKENLFDENFKIYSDFELFLRVRKMLPKNKIAIIDDVVTNFVADGISTKTDYKIVKKRAKEKYLAYKKNGYSRIYFFESFFWEYFKALYFKMHKGKK